jgi:hypothetical protein
VVRNTNVARATNGRDVQAALSVTVILLLQTDAGTAESVAAAVSRIPGIVGTAVTTVPTT